MIIEIGLFWHRASTFCIIINPVHHAPTSLHPPGREKDTNLASIASWCSCFLRQISSSSRSRPLQSISLARRAWRSISSTEPPKRAVAFIDRCCTQWPRNGRWWVCSCSAFSAALVQRRSGDTSPSAWTNCWGPRLTSTAVPGRSQVRTSIEPSCTNNGLAAQNLLYEQL